MRRKATRQDFEALYETYMDAGNNPFMLWEIMDKEAFLPIVGRLCRRIGYGTYLTVTLEKSPTNDTT